MTTMFCTVGSLGLTGIEPYLVTVEADSRRGLPGFDLVGLPDAAVKEARERVRSAIQNLGYEAPNSKLIVNLAPADTKKQGSIYDLPILVALINACGYEKMNLEGVALIGEVGLSGEIRAVPGVLPMVLDAARLGFSKVVVPQATQEEASVAEGVEVYSAAHARQVVDWLTGKGQLPLAAGQPRGVKTLPQLADLADVKGQQGAKRALEVAAAGGHNLLLIGPPGTGKSMLARRLPSILPPMAKEEAIETTKLYSVAGELGGGGLLWERPFRSPHHTASPAALTGGGANPLPGDLSLAHNGVLFLDELPEFQKNSLEVLRQPLEDGRVSISRVRQRVSYPARAMLVCAMNPCPCGFYGHPSGKCACRPEAIARYLGKVSGPMLDRMDIQIEVMPIDYEAISAKGKAESSAAVRERVEKARHRQQERYRGTGITCNALLTPALLREACELDEDASALLRRAFDRLGLSARGYDRILKVSRTVADLEGAERIQATHVAQAIQFRSLDRRYWGR